jgi:hypothetical protein
LAWCLWLRTLVAAYTMGLLDNMARSMIFILAGGTAVASFGLLPVLTARRKASAQGYHDGDVSFA